MRRLSSILLAVSTLVAGLALSAVPAGATHEYVPSLHWRATRPAAIDVVDRTAGGLAGPLQNAVAIWNAQRPDLIRLASLYWDGNPNPWDCTPIEGKIVACYSDRAYVTGTSGDVNGHIGHSVMYLNSAANNAVVLHEMGHALGLRHHTYNPDGSGDCIPNQSVMCGAENGVTALDKQALSMIYDHDDRGRSVVLYGQYRFVREVETGYVLDIPYSSGDQNVGVILYPRTGNRNQRLTVEPMGDGTYRMIFNHSQKALTGAGHGSQVVQSSWTGAAGQRWQIVAVPGGVQLRNALDGRCMTRSGPAWNGWSIERIWDCFYAGHPHQTFALDP